MGITTNSELERFKRDLEENADLKQKFAEATKDLGTSIRDDLGVASSVIQGLGYDVSTSDLERLVAEEEEVSDVEEINLDYLSNVAGGSRGGLDIHDGWCWKNDNCIFVYMCNYVNM